MCNGTEHSGLTHGEIADMAASVDIGAGDQTIAGIRDMVESMHALNAHTAEFAEMFRSLVQADNAEAAEKLAGILPSRSGGLVAQITEVQADVQDAIDAARHFKASVTEPVDRDAPAPPEAVAALDAYAEVTNRIINSSRSPKEVAELIDVSRVARATHLAHCARGTDCDCPSDTHGPTCWCDWR